MVPELLKDVILIFGLGMAVVYLFHRLRLPTIVGFLLTGVLAGPHGLGLITDPHEVEMLAELGVVLLLFTIGLEFSFGELGKMARPLLLGGSVQVLLTVAGGAAAGLLWGEVLPRSIFLGFLAALSSTAIVLKVLQEKAGVSTPQGRTTLAILIFQDLIVVAMLILTPFLAGTAGRGGDLGLWLMLKGFAVAGVVLLAARWATPRVLRAVAGTRDRELFLITIAAILLGIAWLTAWAGLSLALGAFLAGLIVADSPYAHQAVGNVLPLRDLFTSLFFVSIGMLMDLSFLAAHPGGVALGVAAVLAFKTLTAGLASLALGQSVRVALATGLMLSQVGEFSFVLAKAGVSAGLVDQAAYQFILDVSVITMALTPLLMKAGELVAARGRGNVPVRPGGGHRGGVAGLTGHVIVVGYGINGRNVTRAARASGIPYVILEMNPATVRREEKAGEPIVYGDAVNPAVLEFAGVKEARVMVIAIADPVATRRIVATAKEENPALHIIARTRFIQEVEELLKLGAEEVIPEEYETSLEIFARVLRRFLVPADEIDGLVDQIRSEGYGMLRKLELPGAALCDLTGLVPDLMVSSVRVGPGSPAAGRSLAELDLRRSKRVTVLALRRGGEVLPNPAPDLPLQPEDYLICLAKAQDMAGLSGLLASPGA